MGRIEQGPGLRAGAILETAARTGRYSAIEVDQLAFEGDAPGAVALESEWHRILAAARETIAILPPDSAGACVLAADGTLLRVGPSELVTTLESGGVLFHRGSIRGAMPVLVDST